MQNRKRKSLGHDPDDGVRGVTETHGSAQDVCVGTELTLPLLIADDDDGRCTGTFVLVEEPAPEERLHPCQPQSGRGDGGDADQLHVSIFGNEVALFVTEGAQLGHRLHPIVPVTEIEGLRTSVSDRVRPCRRRDRQRTGF